jgi:hypothetical protein
MFNQGTSWLRLGLTHLTFPHQCNDSENLVSRRNDLRRTRSPLAYYITAHGFGHAVRSCEILRSLIELEPAIRPIVVSNIPDFLVEQNVGMRLPMRRARLDVGLIQRDDLRFDLDKTLSILKQLREDSTRIVEREKDFLRKEQVKLVVSDIAFLPFEAAEACGIPGIGISNFTWDWIYGAYTEFDSEWNRIISWIREKYEHCSLFLQLPMHGDCSACPRIENVPLVARKANRSGQEVRSILGLDGNRKIFLVSFTALELSEGAVERLETINNVIFLYKSPLVLPLSNARSLDESGVSYVDAVAASDAVITKPGYGIVSDCLANGTPIIYTDRGIFAEYPVLVDEIERNLTAVYLHSRDFLVGNWGRAIEQISLISRKVPNIPTNGAQACARRILESL